MLRRVLWTVLLAGFGLTLLVNTGMARDLRITGSGASFPAPLYLAWFSEYNRITDGVRINYQSVGSGAGVRSFMNRTVDFAASDSGISEEDMAQVNGGVVVLPMTAGEIVLAYNLPGVPELKLPRDVYPLIFAGEITRWNDPRIAEANPGVTLPDRQLTAVARSDSSGTTYVFTQHLSAINETFAEKIGTGTNVPWPQQPNFIAAPRNDGVAATIAQTPGAIGYMEYFFATRTNASMAQLENASGNFAAPGDRAGQAALASADMSGDSLQVWVTDPDDPEAYPIATFTWMLFFGNHGNANISAALRDFVKWAMADGQEMAPEFGYIQLPPELRERVLAEMPNIQ